MTLNGWQRPYGSTVPELRRALQSVIDSFTSETSRVKEFNEILFKQGFEDEATGETEQMVLRRDIVGDGIRYSSEGCPQFDRT